LSCTIDRLAGCTLAVILFLAAGCQGASYAPQGPGLITVVTTTTVFADMVRNVGGDRIQVTSLVSKNGDVHTYAAKPSDVQAVANARLLVMNGLGLDDWLTRTIANASSTGTPLVKLGEGLPGVMLLPGQEPGTQNPHLWMDVGYAELYVDRIAAALEKVDPPHAADYQRQAAAYRQRLANLDAQVRAQVATIPIANRRLVTFHDAFPYYARAYGITIVGVAVEAPGQDPSAGYTAQLIDAIKAARVKAIFSEAQFPPRLVDQLGAATGAKVVANLYDDALGDPPVTSYEAVITWDTAQLVQALR
jgi:ABC-type Zn uptake system ZnuABC Zn-binding protein ZnuA